MDKVTLTIDSLNVVAERGMTILEAALGNGIYIPHLCYHPDLRPAGACRLCIVEIEDGQLVTASRVPVKGRIVVRTRSPEVDKMLRPIVEVLIANHHSDCRGCHSSGQCELQKIIAHLRIDRRRVRLLKLPKPEPPRDTSNPFFDFDPNKCVLCGICVRTCKNITGISAIDFINRGYATKIGTFGDKPFAHSRCESCGECVIRCPVGALIAKKAQRPKHKVKSVCPYCGVGCGFYLGTRDNVIINTQGNTDNPANKGNLCVKGRFGLTFVTSPERLTSPLIKKNGELTKVSWDEALELVAIKLTKYRGEQFALITSTKCTNEENYIAQKFARVVMNTNNIDSGARLCHTPNLRVLHETIGIGAMTNSIEEIDKTACILAIGTNITQAQPVIGFRIRKAVRNGSKLIVINPKENDLCRLANIWLRPYPVTDVALLMGICRLIVEEGLLDTTFIKKRCENFDEFKKSLDDFPLGRVERITGVPQEMIAAAARIYATIRPAAILWSTGITQHSQGTDNVFALVNLALLTGNIGKPSSGLYPLLGQNNAQGACDMGCLPGFYPGYQMVTDAEVRKKFEVAWGISLNSEPGLALTEIFQAVLEGKVKVLYIIGSEPILSMADSQKVKGALEKVAILIAQDIFSNETAKFAHVVLLAASFAEKRGTFTNMERRVQKLNKAIEPIGDSLPDWKIICELAKRLDGKGFDFSSPEEIMSEIASVAPMYGGISYNRLDKERLQWSCLTPEDLGTSILYGEQFHTPNGKAKFTPLEYKRPAETPDVDYPLILTTESNLYQQGTLSHKVAGLNILGSKNFVEINSKDAADLGVNDGNIVQVISRRGEIIAGAKVTDASPPGVVTMSFHFIENQINMLTNPALDPVAKTPAAKMCPVRIVPQT